MKINHLLSNARQYKKASLRCSSMKNNEDGSIEMLLLPSLVLLSFSVELYLKFVLFKEGKKLSNGKPLHGHKLFELIKKLSPKSNRLLMQRSGFEESDKFNDYAYLHSEIFVKWRYIYEYSGEELGTVNPSFLFGLCDALEFIILVNNYES